MGYRLNIDALKKEYIGKTINWLTVVDIYRDDNNIIMFKCRCRCGSVKSYPKKTMTSKRPKISCGCYKSSPEKSERLRQYHIDHPELKERISAKMKQMYKDNPDKAREIGDRNRQMYIDNPSLRDNVGRCISNWFKNDKDGVAEWADHRREFYKDHPEIGQNRSKLYKENPDIVKRISDGNKKFNADHINKVIRINNINKCIAIQKRQSSNYDRLLEIIHPKYVDDLLNGNIKAGDIIETKCPVCGNYAPHKINDVYVLSKSVFKNGKPPLCKECHVSFTSNLTSKYEQEIADYISTFYNGELVKNNRSILNGKELDLYYPESQIAIEFNGDYWHDENHKSKDYHYGKFKECLRRNIILISVFENHWVNNKDLIMSYIHDSFNDISNSLSFNKDGYMNNNYPSPNCYIDINDYLEDCYSFRDGPLIYTCGYSKLCNDAF